MQRLSGGSQWSLAHSNHRFRTGFARENVPWNNANARRNNSPRSHREHRGDIKTPSAFSRRYRRLSGGSQWPLAHSEHRFRTGFARENVPRKSANPSKDLTTESQSDHLQKQIILTGKPVRKRHLLVCREQASRTPALRLLALHFASLRRAGMPALRYGTRFRGASIDLRSPISRTPALSHSRSPALREARSPRTTFQSPK